MTVGDLLELIRSDALSKESRLKAEKLLKGLLGEMDRREAQRAAAEPQEEQAKPADPNRAS